MIVVLPASRAGICGVNEQVNVGQLKRVVTNILLDAEVRMDAVESRS